MDTNKTNIIFDVKLKLSSGQLVEDSAALKHTFLEFTAGIM